MAVHAADDDLDALDDGREEADLSVHFEVDSTHSYLFMKKILTKQFHPALDLEIN